MIKNTNSSGSLEFTFKYSSVNEFYRDVLIVTPEGNHKHWREFKEGDNSSFRGMSLENILKNKFSYRDGLKKLKDISDITVSEVGGSAYTTKWDEFDGDEMSMGRLMDGAPAMSLKQKTKGDKVGKFITIKVVISENAFVGKDQMLWKTYTAAKLVDSLEKEGFRTKVIIVEAGTRPGTYRGKTVAKYITEVTLKNFSDPLNLSLMITTVSPWCFRYWFFLFLTSKFKTESGLGQAIEINDEESNALIVINKGECLSKTDSNKKIKQIKTLILGNNE